MLACWGCRTSGVSSSASSDHDDCRSSSGDWRQMKNKDDQCSEHSVFICFVSKEKYSDGCCWRCPGVSHYASLRLDSMIAGKQISAKKILHLLWLYCSFSSVCQASVTLSMEP